MRSCPACHKVYAGADSFCPADGNRLVEATAPSDPRLGEILGGRFVLERRLGQGGMGVVYLARHRHLERPYAIKLLLPELVADARAVSRFFREARAASALHHPHLVGLHDYGRSERGEPYLVMDYVEGVTLFDLIGQLRERCLPPAQAVDICIQVARALRHAHEHGVIHRDIKPDNIVLTEHDGAPDWVKVLDFGVARIIGQPPLTRIGEEIVGTPLYMAPEMAAGGDFGTAADLYALGILLYELLCGAPPFEGSLQSVLLQQIQTPPPPPRARRPGLPQELDALVLRLLAKQPEQRPDAADTISALEQVRTKLPPRSLRSLQIAQTLILTRGEPAAQPSAPTVISRPRLHEAPTVIRPGEQRGAATVLLAELLGDINQIESEIEAVSGQLFEEVMSLAGRVWAGGWPAAAHALRERLDGLWDREQQDGVQLALLDDAIEEMRARVAARREAIRRQVLDLSERLQTDGALGERGRAALAAAIEQHEAALPALDQDERRAWEVMDGQRGQAREALQALRGQRLAVLGQLTRHVLASARAADLGDARGRIEELDEQMQAAVAMRDAHLRRAPRG